MYKLPSKHLQFTTYHYYTTHSPSRRIPFNYVQTLTSEPIYIDTQPPPPWTAAPCPSPVSPVSGLHVLLPLARRLLCFLLGGRQVRVFVRVQVHPVDGIDRHYRQILVRIWVHPINRTGWLRSVSPFEQRWFGLALCAERVGNRSDMSMIHFAQNWS